MLRLTVREAAEKRGIKSPAELARALGHRSRTIAGRLWNGESVQFQTLSEVAEVFDCDPGEIIERVRQKKAQKSPLRKGGSKKRR